MGGHLDSSFLLSFNRNASIASLRGGLESLKDGGGGGDGGEEEWGGGRERGGGGKYEDIFFTALRSQGESGSGHVKGKLIRHAQE